MIKGLEQRVFELVPEAPLSLVREKVKWAARELCTESDAWVSDEVPLVYGADTDCPTLSAPLGELVRVIYLVLQDRQERAGKWFTQIGTNQIHFHKAIEQSEVWVAPRFDRGWGSCRRVVSCRAGRSRLWLGRWPTC